MRKAIIGWGLAILLVPPAPCDGRSTSHPIGGRSDEPTARDARVTARWLGQVGSDRVNRSPKAGPNGVQDMVFTVAGLPPDREIERVIVRGHGGTLDVRSRPGAGTTLVVYLPASDGPLAPAVPAPAATPSRGGKVLVVEDEPLVRELARGILERAGFEVLVAPDGGAAAEELARAGASIDAVLLDLTTPGLSGPAAFRALRAVRPDLPIVLTSGYAQADATREFGEEELAGFLKKPFVASELLERIHAAIRRADARRTTPDAPG